MLGRHCLRAVLLAGLFVPLASCGGDGLSKIVLAPETASVTVGQVVCFTAWGYYGNSSKPMYNKNITNSVTWGLASSALAGYSDSPGCYMAVGVGSTTIGASAPGYNGTIGASAAVTVEAAATTTTTRTEPKASEQ